MPALIPSTFNTPRVSSSLAPSSFRLWSEIREEALTTSEALGIPLNKAFRLVLTMDRCTISVEA